MIDVVLKPPTRISPKTGGFFSRCAADRSKMGGGNAQKSAMKRERNAKANAAANKMNPKEAAKQQIFYVCNICRSTFSGTSKKPELELHSTGKHPKNTFAEVFPNYEATLTKVQAQRPAKGKAKKEKKGKKK